MLTGVETTLLARNMETQTYTRPRQLRVAQAMWSLSPHGPIRKTQLAQNNFAYTIWKGH